MQEYASDKRKFSPARTLLSRQVARKLVRLDSNASALIIIGFTALNVSFLTEGLSRRLYLNLGLCWLIICGDGFVKEVVLLTCLRNECLFIPLI